MTKIKLFCLPYAGGSAVIYHRWKSYLGPGIELVPIELAGRGKRIREPLYRDAAEAVDDVFRLIEEHIGKSPYVLFGYSMGCMIVYELAQKIRHHNLPRPLHIFFAGRAAPHVKRADDKKYHLMSHHEFRDEVIQLGGTPPEFFDHPELLDLFLPLLKNDFKLAEEDMHNGEIVPFDEGITVFVGKEDDLTHEECEGWKMHSRKGCRICYFDGGHFFIQHNDEQIVQLINDTVENL